MLVKVTISPFALFSKFHNLSLFSLTISRPYSPLSTAEVLRGRLAEAGRTQELLLLDPAEVGVSGVTTLLLLPTPCRG